MSASLFFDRIVFSDGTELNLEGNDIVVVTGPNNSGKSNVLRNLHSSVGKIVSRGNETVAFTKTRRQGSPGDFYQLIGRYFDLDDEDDGAFIVNHQRGRTRLKSNTWVSADLDPSLAELFTMITAAAGRFQLVANQQAADFNAAIHPLQKLRFAEPVEKDIGQYTKQSFGIEVLCHLNGTTLELKVGDRKDFPLTADLRTAGGQHKARLLRNLTSEGDGLQAFIGLLMAALVHPKSVTLIDEPEAFLHPPQARRLAQILAKKTDGSQLFVATHDYEFLRGVLSASMNRVHVVRISRPAGVTVTKHLSNEKIAELWSDPILYTSDLLSALFHEVAVICEGDSDVRFFRALLDAQDEEGELFPDIRLFSCGSKQKISKVADALQAVGVPVIAVTDCDILKSWEDLSRAAASLGVDARNSLRADYLAVASAIEEHHVSKTTAAVIAEIRAVLIQSEADTSKALQSFPKKARDSIKRILDHDSLWKNVKRNGRNEIVSTLPNVLSSFDELLRKSSDYGLLILERGELEGFWPEGPRGNKREWLAKVLEMDLKNDPRLNDARSFAKSILVAASAKLASAAEKVPATASGTLAGLLAEKEDTEPTSS